MSDCNTGKLNMEVDDVAFSPQECQAPLRSVCEVEVKTVGDSIFAESRNQMCNTSYSPMGGGRSRHNLSEAEKEAKRIRRVLANRESARRTIRRRQALCENLTSRAAELTEENQRLKQKKELALKENESLEATNRNLKAQIASTELNPVLWNACASSSRIHSSAYGNHQEGTYNAAPVTPTLTSPSLCQRDLPREQEKLLNIAGPGPPGYMVPRPWSVTHPSSSPRSGNWIDDFPAMVKPEPPFIVGDLNEAPVQSPPLGSSSSQSDAIPEFAKFLDGAGFCCDLNYTGSESVPIGSSSRESIPRTASLGNKLSNAIAATEARRRRIEIKRLKSINNGRQC